MQKVNTYTRTRTSVSSKDAAGSSMSFPNEYGYQFNRINNLLVQNIRHNISDWIINFDKLTFSIL